MIRVSYEAWTKNGRKEITREYKDGTDFLIDGGVLKIYKERQVIAIHTTFMWADRV